MKFYVDNADYYSAVTDDLEEAKEFFLKNMFLNVDILEAELTEGPLSKFEYRVDVYSKNNVYKIYLKKGDALLGNGECSHKELFYDSSNVIQELKKYYKDVVETYAFKDGKYHKIYYNFRGSYITYYSKKGDTVKNIFKNGTIVKYKNEMYKIHFSNKAYKYIVKVDKNLTIRYLLAVDKILIESKKYVMNPSGNYTLYTPRGSEIRANLGTYKYVVIKIIEEFVMNI